MASLRGRLLLAGPGLLDPNFFRAVVLVLEHNDEGTVGVVLNRPTDVSVLDALTTWAGVVSDPSVVFVGGPVEPGTALALGRGSTEADIDDPVVADIVVVDLESPVHEWRNVRIFSGYAGWSAGQLEWELTQDAWFLLDAAADDICTAQPDELWASVLRRQPPPLSLLARYPDEPAFN